MSKTATLLQQAGLAGDMTTPAPATTLQALRDCLAGVPYRTLGIKALDFQDHDLESASTIVATALGQPTKSFGQGKQSYINPAVAARSLESALSYLKWAAENHKTIAFATGHPGSLLASYQLLAEQVRQWGATVFRPATSEHIEANLWLDAVGDCLVAGDEASLHHSHHGEVLEELLRRHRIDVVVADHGFAAAAINTGKPAVIFFGPDDVAIPLVMAAHGDDILGVPINDSQKNLVTATAIAQALKHYRA